MKHNPVAKYAKQFNKSSIQRDRKKDYQRKSKHRDDYHG